MPLGTSLAPLAHRFARLRRRMRLLASFRGISWLIAVVVAVAVVEGMLDWWLHLPGPVRTFFLAGALSGAGIVIYRFLVQPLGKPVDDLALALQIESAYPELNDCLASTVQFLQQGDEQDRSLTGTMRRAAVAQALRRSADFNFNLIVDTDGVRSAGLAMFTASALALGLLLGQPETAGLALHRLLQPFGGPSWPTETRLQLEPFRTRIARGDPFDIRSTLQGVIPERAVVRLWLDGSNPSEQTFPITPGEDPASGTLTARLEPLRIQRSFRFQVQAHDAVTAWQQVQVLPPVALVPLNGRPSPQIRLRFPAYTELPNHDLPAGTSTIEAVLGTHITLRAATDRPVASAWLEYRPEQPSIQLGHFLGLLGARHGAEAITLAWSGQSVWGRLPIQRQSQGAGTVLQLQFVPWVSGTYALRLIDDSNLASVRLLEVRVVADPAPLVALERPSASQDSLMILPTGSVTIQTAVDDPQFAVRSVWLEVRGGKEEPARRRLLYRYREMETGLPMLLAALAAKPQAALPPLHLRPVRLDITRQLSLTEVHHADGRPLKEGDVVILQAAADDFDDISFSKEPGKSHEVELRIVGLPVLEAMLHQAQEQLQQELQRLREQQREALKKVDGVEKQWRNTGRLRPEDIDHLLQAEQLQQQIRGRVGDKQEGLRAEVAKIQQTLRDNNLPKSGTSERMDMVARELARLAREELEQIEPLLTGARKENELAQDQARPDKKARGALTQAVQHQEEVERTLTEILAGLDPFSSTRQARAETRALLQEERKLAAQTDKLGKEIPPGHTRDAANPQARLKPEELAELDQAADQQARLAEQARELLNKMNRIAAQKNRQADEKEAQAKEKARLEEEKRQQAEKERGDNLDRARLLAEDARALGKENEQLQDAARTLREEAETLEKAASMGRTEGLDGQMKEAAGDIRNNQLGKAGLKQQQSTKILEKMAKALEDRREEELDQLAKKLRQAEQELERLIDEQEKLQKKVQEAQALGNPKEREEALQKLAREQERLRKEVREMAQQLSRLRAGQAGQALRQAGGEMDQAGQMLERGDGNDAQAEQDEALDRLEDALEELREARADVQDELAREKLIKIAEQLKLLKERQDALLPETERIHRLVLQNQRWPDALLRSLHDESKAQKGLAEDALALAENKLKDAQVFDHILRRSAKAMADAAAVMKKRVERVRDQIDPDKLDRPAEEAAYQQTRKHQQDAANYLQQLLDALQEAEGMGRRGGGGGGGGGAGAGGGGRESDGIPHIAQLKVLRALQQEVNRQTEEFARKNPDPAKLTDQQKEELARIRQEQATIKNLFDELTAPPEGGKP